MRTRNGTRRHHSVLKNISRRRYYERHNPCNEEKSCRKGLTEQRGGVLPLLWFILVCSLTVCVCLCVATHQFVHKIWVGAGGEQLSAGQGLVDKWVVLKGIPKGRLHPTDAGLQHTSVWEGGGNTTVKANTSIHKLHFFFILLFSRR